MKKIFIFLILIFLCKPAFSATRLHTEKYYQNLWAKEHNAQTECTLKDKSRVDCVTENYALEVDFADKWAEAIGQSLYYGLCLNKKPAILLIMENCPKDIKHLNKLTKVAQTYGIKIFTICP